MLTKSLGNINTLTCKGINAESVISSLPDPTHLARVPIPRHVALLFAGVLVSSESSLSLPLKEIALLPQSFKKESRGVSTCKSFEVVL